MSMECCFKFLIHPLLILTGGGIFVLGLMHLALCQPFYFVAPGILDGVFVLIAAFHGICLPYPNKCALCLQLVSIVLGMSLLPLSALEALCQHQAFFLIRPIVESAVCFGLSSRTDWLQPSCASSVGLLTPALPCPDCRDQGYNATIAAKQIGFLTSSSLSLLALIQIVLSACIAGNAMWECAVRVRPHHLQCGVALLTMLFGAVHTFYCCTYSYVGLGMWMGLLILLQALFTWRTNARGAFVRAMNVLGAGLGLAVTVLNAFGLFCWTASVSDPLLYRRKCVWRPLYYEDCNRRLEFGTLYYKWPTQLREEEVRQVQLTSLVGLCVFGIVQFTLSIITAFTKPDQYDLY